MNRLFTAENLSKWIDTAYEDEDEQLKLALKLSIESVHEKKSSANIKQSSKKDVIIIDDDVSQEQQDIEKAIQLSLASTQALDPPKPLKNIVSIGNGEWFYVNSTNSSCFINVISNLNRNLEPRMYYI